MRRRRHQQGWAQRSRDDRERNPRWKNRLAGKHRRQRPEIVHCILHKTGGSRESYCRIVPEAYAYGVPIIVEDDFAFPELVENGVTGYRCSSSDEMSFRASELAFDEPRRKKMIFSAREHLLHEIASPERCWAAWERLF
jgi:glycosyltransferase involved in cell wall biosynthesis